MDTQQGSLLTLSESATLKVNHKVLEKAIVPTRDTMY